MKKKRDLSQQTYKFPSNMNRVKEELQKQGRTQVWLAKKIGKSYVVVNNYCNNKAQMSIPILFLMANALDIDVRDLLVPSKKK
jgi:putative transcriptional regulator